MDMHTMSAPSGHLDHAHMLLLATVPTCLALVLGIFASAILVCALLRLFAALVIGVAPEPSPPRQRESQHYARTPRAPPYGMVVSY